MFWLSLLQIWCATGVFFPGGKTKDGASLVGRSVFYDDPSSSATQPPSGDIERLDREIEVRKCSTLVHLLGFLVIEVCLQPVLSRFVLTFRPQKESTAMSQRVVRGLTFQPSPPVPQ